MKSDLSIMLDSLCHGHSLTIDQSATQFELIAQEKYSPIEISAFLIAMKAKGETVEEILGAVLAMKKLAKSVPHANLNQTHCVVDCVGTGGDGHHTLNISSAVAVVLACFDVTVAKHGNHAVSSKCGAADVFKSMGVKLDIDPEHAVDILKKIGICFLYAPFYHPAARVTSSVRKILGVRTIFNLIGPLLNPLQPNYQLIGVYDPKFCHILSQVLKKLDVKRSLVIHGSGIDEIAIHGPTQGTLLYDGKIADFTLLPEDVGLKRYTLETIKGTNIEYNIKEFRNLLMGNGTEAYQAAVAINAGTVLWLIGKTSTITDGVKMVKNILNTGLPFQRIQLLAELSHA